MHMVLFTSSILKYTYDNILSVGECVDETQITHRSNFYLYSYCEMHENDSCMTRNQENVISLLWKKLAGGLMQYKPCLETEWLRS